MLVAVVVAAPTVDDPEVVAAAPEGEDVELWLAVEQTTDDGRFVTPLVLQRFWANVVAASWSAALQAEARQHAIEPKKSLFEQIQAISGPLHPAICVPEVNWVTQGFCKRSATHYFNFIDSVPQDRGSSKGLLTAHSGRPLN